MLENKKIDIIFHLGEYSRVEQSYSDFNKIMDYNNIGTSEILKYLYNNNVRVIYAGSSTKFSGIGSTGSPYALAKSHNTEWFKQMYKWYDKNIQIVYFHNVYGKDEESNSKYATVIGKFKELTKKEIVINNYWRW